MILTRNAAARGVTVIVEASPDLVNWTPLATSVNGGAPTGSASISEGAGTVRAVQVDTPAGTFPTFYRARVTTP